MATVTFEHAAYKRDATHRVRFPRDLAVLTTLVKDADGDGVANLSQFEIATDTTLSPQAVHKSIKRLERDGWIQIHHQSYTDGAGVTHILKNVTQLRTPPEPPEPSQLSLIS